MRLTNHEIKTNGRGNKIRLSVTIKWAMATSFFIFILFTIFSVVAYQTATQVIFQEEEKNIQTTLDEIVGRLSRSSHNLTASDTVNHLKEKINYEDDDQSDVTGQVDVGVLQLDAFISALSQGDLYTMVYNSEGKKIFETKSLDIQLRATNKREISIQKIGQLNGFLAVEPVYASQSKELIGYVQLFYQLDTLHAIRKKLLLTLVGLEALAVVLSSVLAYFLSAHYLKPLKRMSDTLRAVRDEPDANIRLPELKTNDELSDLTDAFNILMERMERYIDSQQSFVEDVSHELRTPVAIIEGHLNLLTRWGKDDPEILEESLQASVQEIIRMKTLIQEMLDLSRIEQVPPGTIEAETNATSTLNQTVTNFKLLYPNFNFEIFDYVHKEVMIRIQQNHFEQILIILLDNAVKYSTVKKEVVVKCKASLDVFQVSIADFGEGIAKENYDKIFDRFYRVDKARSREKGGNGLGLSIAKQLLLAVNGKILVESAEGIGTTFIIQVPIVR